MAVDGIDGRLSLIVLVIVLISMVSWKGKERKGKREGEERRGEEPVSVENQRADAGQDGQTCLAR